MVSLQNLSMRIRPVFLCSQRTAYHLNQVVQMPHVFIIFWTKIDISLATYEGKQTTRSIGQTHTVPVLSMCFPLSFMSKEMIVVE